MAPDGSIPCEELPAGMVGYITASIKNVKDTRVEILLQMMKIPVPSLCRDIKK